MDQVRVNGLLGSDKPREREPGELISLGGRPRCGRARSAEAFRSWSLVLAVSVGTPEVAHRWVSFWFIPLALLIACVVWIALSAYADHLVRQGQYDRALKLGPLAAMSGAGRSYFRGDVLTSAGRYEEAERMLREIVGHTGAAKKVDTVLALEDLGNVLMDTGRFEEAQKCFQSAAGIYPRRSPWANGLAEVLLRQGVHPLSALKYAEGALSSFRGGIERISEGWRLGTILATKAWALAACGRGAEAREAVDAALKSPAQKTKGPLAQVHYKAGMTLLALSDRHAAKEHFARGAELDPAGRWGGLCIAAQQRRW